MASAFLKKIAHLDLEEKILNAGLLVAAAGVFFPWIGGQLSIIDETVQSFSGLGFHTSFLGLAVLGLSLYTLGITLVPLGSKRMLVRKELKESVRLYCSSLATILTLASLSVLVKVTFQSSGMQVRFGVYMTLIGCMVATLYSFLAMQDRKKKDVQELFHHPDLEQSTPAPTQQAEQQTFMPPAQQAPTPPPAPKPEEQPVTRVLSGTHRR